MTIEQRLTDYQHQLWDTEYALERAKERMRTLEAELHECEVRGEMPTSSLMNDLKDAEAWIDWYIHECYELRVAVEECEAALAGDDE